MRNSVFRFMASIGFKMYRMRGKGERKGEDGGEGDFTLKMYKNIFGFRLAAEQPCEPTKGESVKFQVGFWLESGVIGLRV